MVTQNALRTCEVKFVFFLEMNFKFTIPTILTNAFKHIKLPISLYTCLPIAVLPSNVCSLDIQSIIPSVSHLDSTHISSEEIPLIDLLFIP